MRGYGDPLFRNVAAPFKADPPKTPRDYNPTGAYRTTFTVPADWSGEEVFLRFEKVASASFLWVNGQEVGLRRWHRHHSSGSTVRRWATTRGLRSLPSIISHAI